MADAPQNDSAVVRDPKLGAPKIARTPDHLRDEAALPPPRGRQYGEGGPLHKYDYDGSHRRQKEEKLAKRDKVKPDGDERVKPTEGKDPYKHERVNKTAERLAGVIKSGDTKAAIGEISRMQAKNPEIWQKVAPLLTARMQKEGAIGGDIKVIGSDGASLVTLQPGENGGMVQRRSAADLSKITSQEPNLPKIELIENRKFSVTPDGRVSVAVETDKDSTWGLVQRYLGKDHQTDIWHAVKTAGAHPELVHKGDPVSFSVPLVAPKDVEEAPAAPPPAIEKVEKKPEPVRDPAKVEKRLEPVPAPNDGGFVQQDDGTFKRMGTKKVDGIGTDYTTEILDKDKHPQSNLVEHRGNNDEFLGSTLTLANPASRDLPNAKGEKMTVDGITQLVRDGDNNVSVLTQGGEKYTFKNHPDDANKKYVLENYESPTVTDAQTGISAKTIQTVGPNGEVTSTVQGFKKGEDKPFASVELPNTSDVPSKVQEFKVNPEGTVSIANGNGEEYLFRPNPEGADKPYALQRYDSPVVRDADTGIGMRTTQTIADNGDVSTTVNAFAQTDQSKTPIGSFDLPTVGDQQPTAAKSFKTDESGNVTITTNSGDTYSYTRVPSTEPGGEDTYSYSKYEGAETINANGVHQKLEQTVVGDTTITANTNSQGDGTFISSKTVTETTDPDSGVVKSKLELKGEYPNAKVTDLSGQPKDIPNIQSVENISSDKSKVVMTTTDGTRYTGRRVDGGGVELDKVETAPTVADGYATSLVQTKIKGQDGAPDDVRTETNTADTRNGADKIIATKIVDEYSNGRKTEQYFGPNHQSQGSREEYTQPTEGVEHSNDHVVLFRGPNPAGVEGTAGAVVRTTHKYDGALPSQVVTDQGNQPLTVADIVRRSDRAPDNGPAEVRLTTKDGSIYSGTVDNGAIKLNYQESVEKTDEKRVRTTVATETDGRVSKSVDTLYNDGHVGAVTIVDFAGQEKKVDNVVEESIVTDENGVKETIRTADGAQIEAVRTDKGLVEKFQQSHVTVEGAYHEITQKTVDGGSQRTDAVIGDDKVISAEVTLLDDSNKTKSVSTLWKDDNRGSEKLSTGDGDDHTVQLAGIQQKDVTIDGDKTTATYKTDSGTYTFSMNGQQATLQSYKAAGAITAPTQGTEADARTLTANADIEAASQQKWDGKGVPPVAEIIAADHPDMLEAVKKALAATGNGTSFEDAFVSEAAKATTTGDLADITGKAVETVKTALAEQRNMELSLAENALGDLFKGTKPEDAPGVDDWNKDAIHQQAIALSALKPEELGSRLNLIKDQYEKMREALAQQMTNPHTDYKPGDVEKFEDLAKKAINKRAAELVLQHSTDAADSMPAAIAADFKTKYVDDQADAPAATDLTKLDPDQRAAYLEKHPGTPAEVPEGGQLEVELPDGKKYPITGIQKALVLDFGALEYVTKGPNGEDQNWVVKDKQLIWAPKGMDFSALEPDLSK